jgi:hypothetical protein
VTGEAATTITSRWSGACRRCGRWYAQGEPIRYAAALGPMHATDARCAEAPAGLTDADLAPLSPAALRAELDDLTMLVRNAKWVQAKPQPWGDHQWTLRAYWPDADFDRLVLGIKRCGVRRRWRADPSRPWSHREYLDLGGWTHWVMDARRSPPSLEFLVNRQLAATTLPLFSEVR